MIADGYEAEARSTMLRENNLSMLFKMLLSAKKR